MTTVEVRRVTRVVARRTILDDVSFATDGGLTVLAGANGAGKSTLLRLLATIDRCAPGQCFVAGHDLGVGAGLRAARPLIGYLPQAPELPINLRVSEAFEYAAWLRRLPADRVAADADLLDATGIAHLADRTLNRLSGGEHRRVMLAVALVGRPQVLLVDEPTVGVDAAHRGALRRILADAAELGTTVILTSHLNDDIELLAERVLVVAHGRLVFDGDPADLAALGARVREGDEHLLDAALRTLDEGAFAGLSGGGT